MGAGIDAVDGQIRVGPLLQGPSIAGLYRAGREDAEIPAGAQRLDRPAMKRRQLHFALLFSTGVARPAHPHLRGPHGKDIADAEIVLRSVAERPVLPDAPRAERDIRS